MEGIIEQAFGYKTKCFYFMKKFVFPLKQD